jgi:translation initiation factor 3 subunit D
LLNFLSFLITSTADGEKYKFSEDNPFVDPEDEEENGSGPSPVASVGYRYRLWDLGDGVKLVARCEHDAVVQGSSEKDVQFMNIKALNEWDSRFAGNVDWRQKLDTQRGAVLANELKHNACKLAKWTVQAMLVGSDIIKFGLVIKPLSLEHL